MKSALILCGGKGTRMGARAAHLPKALLPVHGKPILWYIMGRLYRAGIRHFILPLGYHGHDIVKWLDSVDLKDCQVDAIDTGVNTEIGRRLALVRHRVPENESFVLTNGDALFNFDVEGFFAQHKAAGAMATLCTANAISQFGLIVEQNGVIQDFTRESHIHSVTTIEHSVTAKGSIYSGIAALSAGALDAANIERAADFEIDLFRAMIGIGKLHRFSIDGYWHAIDTPKEHDLMNAAIGWRAAGARQLAHLLEGFAPQR